MGPKVLACIRFVRSGGKRAIITSLFKAYEALHGLAGTVIIPNYETSLNKRSFLKEIDFHPKEFYYLLELSRKLK